MTVLLVDDQISILSGLISNLDWDALGVTVIHTASNAPEAKEILLREPVELLLCDIEMPGETGLSLLRWARKRGMDFVCVFLTSHADFLYAKEAIQLNCFDYILQPARYDDIQAVIARAVSRVKSDHAEKELERYGTIAKNYSSSLFQSFFTDWSAGKSLSLPALHDVLRQLGQEVQPDDDCFVIWGHLLLWRTEPWPTQEWIYAVNNVVAEVYETGDYKLLPFAIDQTSLGWFVYAAGHRFAEPGNVLLPLQKGYLALRRHLPCDFAFYVSPVIPLKQINEQSSVLLNAKRDNVLSKSGVFCPAAEPLAEAAAKAVDAVQLRRWESLLAGGEREEAAREIHSHLEALAQQERMNQNTLRSFWIQFQQSALGVARSQGLAMDPVFEAVSAGNQAQSLQEVDAAVNALLECFPAGGAKGESVQKLAGRIRRFVEENLDKPLNINDIAAALYMNADYLSRQFKTETGVPLKEYIVSQKMEAVKNLLKTTTLPVSVIASKMGYENFSYFSQLYRKTMGVSPSEERREE